MRPLLDMDTIQIELTNACHRSCSNCTRFCGHRKPFFMDFEYFKRAIWTMKDYPKMTGFMGGEPLLHPQFKEMCEYAQTVLPPERLGLWTGLPPGKEHYREVICNTFGHIFVNDHARDDVYHTPLLVASEEIYTERKQLYYVIDKCWIQNAWSACINPKGAFFCEMAGSLSMLFDGPNGWPIEDEWWARTPKDFTSQIEEWCPLCGAALPLPRRCSNDGRDDVSPGSLTRLIAVNSKKVERGQFVVSDLRLINDANDRYPMASYKDIVTRQAAASRYGMYLQHNTMNFLTPVLKGGKILRDTGLVEEIHNAINKFTFGRSKVAEHCRDDQIIQKEGVDRQDEAEVGCTRS